MHRKALLGWLTLFVVVLTGTLWSQTGSATSTPDTGTVIGVVRDSETGDVIRGAKVEVQGLSQTVITDIDGTFSFRLPVGPYTLKVSSEN